MGAEINSPSAISLKPFLSEGFEYGGKTGGGGEVGGRGSGLRTVRPVRIARGNLNKSLFIFNFRKFTFSLWKLVIYRFRDGPIPFSKIGRKFAAAARTVPEIRNDAPSSLLL